MSASSQSVDNLDALLDFSEYDNISAYQSPSLSPATANKNGFTGTQRPVSQATSPTMPTTTQPLTGPSHQYELYKQQTGIVPGALASTLAVSNSQASGYNSMNLDYLGLSPSEDLFDFNTAPSQGSINDMEMDFDSPSNDGLFFESTVSPNALNGQTSPSMSSPPVLSSQTSNVGRLWPGMHSQAALAKAQAQQRQQQQQQQQQIIQQQRQSTAQAKPRSKSNQPTDPIVEQKITQLLNSMRAKPAQLDSQSQQGPLLNLTRPKKDEEEMDEDERLLASEEGKKLSSKERRQLRNKVSARAFRSRRKEYISQLEAEIATKVNENGDLRAQNKALLEENKRLSDLTRMLLSSPSFSNFLDNLSASVSSSSVPQQTQAKQDQAQPERRQVPKDVNPAAYAAATQVQQQQIGMAMIPEQSMDLSMLSLENETTFNFQPQVFAVLETPGMPASLDTTLLSGKRSNFVGEQLDSDDDKVEIPPIDRRATKKTETCQVSEELPLNPEFESNPEFALFHSARAPESSQAPTDLDTDDLSHVDIFGGIEPEKVLARYELLDASEEERSATIALAKIERLSDRLEPSLKRIDQLTLDF